MTAAYYLRLEEINKMAKSPEIKIHAVDPEPVKQAPEPLGPDEEYTLTFAHATEVGEHPMKPGDPVGTLVLKYGMSPELFASLLGRGVMADKSKKKKKA